MCTKIGKIGKKIGKICKKIGKMGKIFGKMGKMLGKMGILPEYPQISPKINNQPAKGLSGSWLVAANFFFD